jgi:intraflagellar transport protein 80
VVKLANFVDEVEWHSTYDIIVARTAGAKSSGELTVWCCPSAIFSTAELMGILKTESRLLFDVSEINAFDATHAFVTAKDGSFCVVPVNPFLIMVHESIELSRNWKAVLQICRAQNDKSLWAVCAALAVQAGEIDAAQEAYAALSMIDRVVFLAKVKKLKSPAARNAMIAVLQGRVSEAEDILIQGGCVFRAIKMNIALGKWDKALAIAKRTNKFLDVVAAYRTLFLRDMDMEEMDPEFKKLGVVEMDSIRAVIRQEKSGE